MRRRATGEVSSERDRGRIWDERYLTLDGWVIPENLGVIDAELREEEELEANNTDNSLAGWQRRMTEKRERIIEREEREFTTGEALLEERNSSWMPLWGENGSTSSTLASQQLAERKKVQEEMTKKLQESLLSTAFTA